MKKKNIIFFLVMLLTISCNISVQAQSMRMEEDYVSQKINLQDGGSVVVTVRVTISPNGSFRGESASIKGERRIDANGIGEVRNPYCEVLGSTKYGIKVLIGGEIWRSSMASPNQFWLHTTFEKNA